VRDPIERLLGIERNPHDLSHLPDQVLADELTSRGWKVENP